MGEGTAGERKEDDEEAQATRALQGPGASVWKGSISQIPGHKALAAVMNGGGGGGSLEAAVPTPQLPRVKHPLRLQRTVFTDQRDRTPLPSPPPRPMPSTPCSCWQPLTSI